MAALEAACKKIGDGKGIFLRGDSYFVQAWIWAYGGGLVNPLKKEILIATKGSINGMTAYKRLFDSSCAFKNEDFANDYNNAQTAFKNGDVAMIENGPWATADVLAGKAFANKANLGIAPLPRGPAGQGSPVGGHSFVVAKKSKNVAAAYKFIQFLTKASNQATFASKNNLLPTRKSAYQNAAVEEQCDHLGVPQPDARRPRAPGAPGGRRDLHRLHPERAEGAARPVDPDPGHERRRPGVEDEALPHLHDQEVGR